MKLIPILLNEFTEKVIEQLIDKFSKERGPSEQIIRIYIERFKQIKNSPKVEKKDPFQYTWKEFEEIVDANRKVDIKAGKLDPTAEDANLIYRKDGIRVYVGKDKKACIKYGNGYSFCISARGDDNMYDDYRTSTFIPPNNYNEYFPDPIANTPYFIFNDNLSSERKGNSFVDPQHILVIFVGALPPKDTFTDNTFNKIIANINKYPREYSVTEAANRAESHYSKFEDIQKQYPWVAPLKNIIKPIDIDKNELEKFKLEIEYDNNLKSLEKKYTNRIFDVNRQKYQNGLFGNNFYGRGFVQGMLEKYGLSKFLSIIENEELVQVTFNGFVINSIGTNIDNITQKRYTTKGNKRDFIKEKEKFKTLLHHEPEKGEKIQVFYYDSTQENQVHAVLKEPIFIEYLKEVDRLQKKLQSNLNKLDLGID